MHCMGRTPNTTCDVCSDRFYKRPSDIEASENHYCSTDCMAKGRSDNYSGENNPNYQGGISKQTKKCETCGVEFETSTYVEGRFCSYECMGESYQGGPHSRVDNDNVRYYGPNWPKQRRKRVIKDCGRCVVCGMTDSQHHEKIQTGLHVHHIEPVATFQKEIGGVDWEKANRLDNLITMCWKCHQKWEGIPVVPQC